MTALIRQWCTQHNIEHVYSPARQSHLAYPSHYCPLFEGYMKAVIRNPRNAGRSKLGLEPLSEVYSVNMTAAQKTRVKTLGGPSWIRDQIDKAK